MNILWIVAAVWLLVSGIMILSLAIIAAQPIPQPSVKIATKTVGEVEQAA